MRTLVSKLTSQIATDPLSGNVVLQWSGGWDGMQFQVEKAADNMGPCVPSQAEDM